MSEFSQYEPALLAEEFYQSALTFKGLQGFKQHYVRSISCCGIAWFLEKHLKCKAFGKLQVTESTDGGFNENWLGTVVCRVAGRVLESAWLTVDEFSRSQDKENSHLLRKQTVGTEGRCKQLNSIVNCVSPLVLEQLTSGENNAKVLKKGWDALCVSR